MTGPLTTGVVQGARTTDAVGPLRSRKPAAPAVQPPAAAPPETPEDRELRARFERVEAQAAERNLRLVRTPYGEHAVRLIRVGAGGVAAEVTPVEGASLDVVERFLSETSPPDVIEAMAVREGQTLLSNRPPRTSIAPEQTAHLTNRDKTPTPPEA